MPVRTTPWDLADQIDTPEHVIAYLDAVFEDGDPALVSHAIGAIARSRGMSQLARETGLAREGLYKSLSAEGNPSFATVVSVLKALGIRLHPEQEARALERS
jgi:probable addiction module antidote protein